MRTSALAFLGLVFVGYWLYTADIPRDQQASFEPQLPALIRILPSSAKQRWFSHPSQDSKSTPDTTGIHRWLLDESMKLGRPDRNPSAAVLQMKQKALSLKPEELKVLRDICLSPSASGDERFLAIYIISLAESAQARDLLKEIAVTPLPQTSGDRAYSDEVVIRANALEAVVRRLNKDESKKYLEDMLAKTQDPSLARHARYWLTRL
jgi:hypothetical protein